MQLSISEALIKQYAFCQDDYYPWERGCQPNEPVMACRGRRVCGTPLPSLRKHLSQVQISAYSFVGEYERNIHNDVDVARQNGFAGTIAHGLQLVGYMSELCTNFFGDLWFISGHLRAKFLRPVYAGSELMVEGRVAVGSDVGGVLPEELWVKDQGGGLVSVACARATTNRTEPACSQRDS